MTVWESQSSRLGINAVGEIEQTTVKTKGGENMDEEKLEFNGAVKL